MQLTPENVKNVLIDCLFKDDEDTTNHIKVESVRLQIGFNPERVEKHRADIEDMLSQLPIQFFESPKGGGGWSFLQACMTDDGQQWGEHTNVDELICLGIAIGKVEFLSPRSMWSSNPGGMPYFVIKN